MITIKQKILETLAQSCGKNVSGKSLADELDVTRSYVWKAVEELRKDGYAISAVPNRGYTLAGGEDILSAAEILRFCREPAEIHLYDTLASTTDKAKLLAAEGAGNFTAVIADGQQAGRGRKGRGFFSPSRTGLYLSVVLRPNLAGEQMLRVTSGAGVAVCRAVEKLTGKHCRIKWVNDIYLNDKKVCGIGTEGVTDFETGRVEFVAVGIGLNLFAPRGGFPKELEDVADFVTEPAVVGRNRMAAEILNQLAALDFLRGDFMKEYRERSWIIGRMIRVYGFDDCYEGRAEDVTEEGYLVVRDGAGVLRTVKSGEVTVRRTEG